MRLIGGRADGELESHTDNCNCNLCSVFDNNKFWLESREFYELMQTYRYAEAVDQLAVKQAFDAVKAYIIAHRDRVERP